MLTILLVLLLVGGIVAAGAWWAYDAWRDRQERLAADALLAQVVGAFEQRSFDGLPASVPDPGERFAATTADLGDVTLSAEAGEVTIDRAGAQADVALTWTFASGLDWRYTTQVDFTRTGSSDPRWQVEWSPGLVHPDLGADERLLAQRVQPVRGDVLSADGQPIVVPRPVVDVLVDPSQVPNPASLGAVLGQTLGIDGDALVGRVAEATESGALVSVITLREESYQEVAATLDELPGIVTVPGELPLAPTREFARAFLGTVGDVTADQLEAEPGRYVAGDLVGRSGLQQAMDDPLRGLPGLTVTAVSGDAEAVGGRPLHDVAPEDGQNVTITLRPEVQLAADAALAEVEQPSAIVAIDVPTGDVLAVANGPAAGFDLATEGQYPPGSIFKLVTSTRFLADGVTAEDSVGCPAVETVDGRDFRNAGGDELGQVPFATAFAQSCNTAFVGLAREFAPGDLQDTAQRYYGIGRRGDLGVGAFPGDVPREESATEVAAAAIGQGRVLVSPVVAADLAATVARGSWLEPRVVLDPEPGDRQTGEELPGAETLQDLTRAVVTSGSGTAAATVPGAEVHGKTGTAEYGTEVPPRTHAWFVGYQGDVAFAVLVAETDGELGGELAAPIAAEFLGSLAEVAP